MHGTSPVELHPESPRREQPPASGAAPQALLQRARWRIQACSAGSRAGKWSTATVSWWSERGLHRAGHLSTASSRNKQVVFNWASLFVYSFLTAWNYKGPLQIHFEGGGGADPAVPRPFATELTPRPDLGPGKQGTPTIGQSCSSCVSSALLTNIQKTCRAREHAPKGQTGW